jgi:hypothetical protein
LVNARTEGSSDNHDRSPHAPRFALRVDGQGQRVRPLLAIYLQDHHAAGVAGARVAKRAALAIEHRADGHLTRVASEISQDLIALEGFMRQLGVGPDRVKDTFSRIAERLGRSKLNGRLLRRSPLSDLLELETLVVGITGKQALWVSLREVLPAQTEELDQLLKRAAQQKRLVENARVEAAKRSLRTGSHALNRVGSGIRREAKVP